MPSLVKVAALSDVPVGRCRTVSARGRKIALYNVDGRIYATADACADQGYSLGTFGTLNGAVVTCGLHYWEYDVRTGDSVDGMDEHLETYPVEVVGEDIYLDIPPPPDGIWDV
jgi:biphenyl 2,3-dioxygenase ferredoxin subunit